MLPLMNQATTTTAITSEQARVAQTKAKGCASDVNTVKKKLSKTLRKNFLFMIYSNSFSCEEGRVCADLATFRLHQFD